VNIVNCFPLRYVSKWSIVQTMACILTKKGVQFLSCFNSCRLAYAITLSSPSCSVQRNIAPNPPLMSPVPVDESTMSDMVCVFWDNQHYERLF
jgi:hypothetical protein